MSAWPITCLPFIGESTSCAGPADPASKKSCTGALDWLVSSPPQAFQSPVSTNGSLSMFWKIDIDRCQRSLDEGSDADLADDRVTDVVDGDVDLEPLVGGRRGSGSRR